MFHDEMKIDLCHEFPGGAWFLGFTIEDENRMVENTHWFGGGFSHLHLALRVAEPPPIRPNDHLKKKKN
jgi:hypothetical protein